METDSWLACFSTLTTFSDDVFASTWGPESNEQAKAFASKKEEAGTAVSPWQARDWVAVVATHAQWWALPDTLIREDLQDWLRQCVTQAFEADPTAFLEQPNESRGISLAWVHLPYLTASQKIRGALCRQALLPACTTDLTLAYDVLLHLQTEAIRPAEAPWVTQAFRQAWLRLASPGNKDLIQDFSALMLLHPWADAILRQDLILQGIVAYVLALDPTSHSVVWQHLVQTTLGPDISDVLPGPGEDWPWNDVLTALGFWDEPDLRVDLLGAVALAPRDTV